MVEAEIEPAAADGADPRWLALPEAKKAVALRRAAAFERHGAISRPDPAQQLAAMAEAGLARTRFYRLLKRWRTNRRLLDLVPHAPAVLGRADAAAAGIVERILRGAPPAAGRAPFSLNARDEGGVVAERFGEFLVVDHPRMDAFVGTGDGDERPELTLVIDLLTSAIVGHDVHLGGPTAAAVARALADAARRSALNAPDADTVSPTTLIPTDWKPEWLDLEAALARAGAATMVRRSPKLHRGHVARRLVGPRIGNVRLLARLPRGDARTAVAQPDRHAVMTMAAARAVVERAIAERNRRLLGPVWPNRLALDGGALDAWAQRTTD